MTYGRRLYAARVAVRPSAVQAGRQEAGVCVSACFLISEPAG